MSQAVETSCLVIGTGLAGLACAVELAERGIDVVMISAATEPMESNSAYAQGGIVYEGAEARGADERDTSAPEGEGGWTHADSESLMHDIQEAGCQLNYKPAVSQVVTLGSGMVEELLLRKAGVAFDRNPSGEFHLTREAAHSKNRVLHYGDQSGRAIIEALLSYARTLPSLRMVMGQTAVNLLMTSFHSKERSLLHEPARCFGAFVFDQETGGVYPVFARHTVLATGGIGQIFLHNTNSKFSRGDGIALAYRAGCRLENLEFLQFHPTTFYHPRAKRFLISEALRGEGAVLVNQNGERFAAKFLPEYRVPELAPRDRLARAIHQELLSTGAAYVYLDISHKPADWIKSRFPFVYRSCLEFGVDATKEPIPVVPGAHYHCGGVWCDLNGATSVPNLWAVGEVSCTGLHGANRLASVSLLEAVVWGGLAGRGIARDVESKRATAHPEIHPWSLEAAEVDPSFLHQDWLTLKHTMWNYVGLIKTDARLRRAEGILRELADGAENFYRKARLSDSLIGLRHAVLVAQLVLAACKRNTRSKGCYLREEREI